jgi:hypothetical protein
MELGLIADIKMALTSTHKFTPVIEVTGTSHYIGYFRKEIKLRFKVIKRTIEDYIYIQR